MTTARPPIRLDRNESPIPWERLEYLRLDPETIRRYPDDAPLARAFAEDLNLHPDFILPTNGGDEAIALALEHLVPDGGRIAIPVPTFSTFEVVCDRLPRTLLRIPCAQDGAFPEKHLLDLCAQEQPEAVVLIDPNNPTGTPVPSGLPRLIRAAAPKTLIILDRAYADFARLDNDAELLAADDRLVIIRSLSKSPGVAGLRIGALIGDSETIAPAWESRLIFSVNSAAVALGVEALRDTEARRRCVDAADAARPILLDALRNLGVPALAGPTNFVLARFGVAAADIVRNCAQQGLLLRDLSACPVFPGAVRITLAEPDTLRAALDILQPVAARALNRSTATEKSPAQ